jgi:hypothetical protein
VVGGAHLQYNIGGEREVVPADTSTLKLKFAQNECFRIRNNITRLLSMRGVFIVPTIEQRPIIHDHEINYCQNKLNNTRTQ